MAVGLVRAFALVARNIWNKPFTLGPTATLASIPLGLAVVDVETEGALFQAGYETTVNLLKEQVKKGASPEAIERTMDGLKYVSALTNRLDKFAQNVAVLEIMGHSQGADAVNKGKAAAIAYQLKPDNLAVLIATQAIRQSFADDLFKGDRNATDKYLASALVKDIVKNAQVNALKDNPVTENDVRKTLTEIINNPDQHPVASKFFSERGRLMNGLKQMWPELSPQQRPSAAASSARTESEENSGRQRSRLGDAFDKAADNDGSMMNMLLMFMVALFQMMGLGKSQTPAPDENRPAARPPVALTPHPGM